MVFLKEQHKPNKKIFQGNNIFMNNYFNDLYSLYIYLIIISLVHKFRANCIKYHTMLKNADFPEPGEKNKWIDACTNRAICFYSFNYTLEYETSNFDSRSIV